MPFFIVQNEVDRKVLLEKEQRFMKLLEIYNIAKTFTKGIFFGAKMGRLYYNVFRIIVPSKRVVL